MNNFKNHFNYTPTFGEEINEPSVTLQGQTVSIAEMLKRIQGGIMPELSTLGYPDDENDIQMRPNDLTAIDAYKTELKQIRNNQIEKQRIDAEKQQKTDVEKDVD